MQLPGIVCIECGQRELISVIPGDAGELSDLFRLTPAYPDYALCWDCWVRKFCGRKPAQTDGN